MISDQIVGFNGKQICLRHYGSRNRDRVILYFHGLPSSRLEASFLRAYARENDLWVIAIDRPGCGLSEYVPRSSPGDLSPALAAILQVLKVKRCRALAVSGGGPYALAAAHDLTDVITSVTLVGSPAPLTEPCRTSGMMTQNRVLLELARGSRTARGIIVKVVAFLLRRFPRLGLTGLRRSSTADRITLSDDLIASSMCENFRESVAESHKGLEDEIQILLSEWPFLKNIKTPCTLYHGSEDRVVPVSSSWTLKRSLGHAPVRLEILPGEGHLLAVRNVARIVGDLMTDGQTYLNEREDLLSPRSF